MQLYSVLKKLAENCDFENREEAIIRDIFITNMLEDDIQRKLLRDTIEPETAISLAVNKDLGHQNQQSNSNNNNRVCAIQQFTQFRSASIRVQQENRTTFNSESDGICRKCRQNWTSTHCQVCPALDEKCNHSVLN